jgi:hypothetical protein
VVELDIMNKFSVIVAGSRGFNDYELLELHCNHLLRNKFNQGIPIEIVSGGARGADTLGEQYAENYCLDIHQFIPDWDLHGKSAGYIRNTQMKDYADALIAFWDQKSRGTFHMINLMKNAGKPFRVVEVV